MLNKKTLIVIALHIFILAITNLLFFLLLHTPAVYEWVAWAAIHFATVISFITHIITWKKPFLSGLRIKLPFLGGFYCGATVISAVAYISILHNFAQAVESNTKMSGIDVATLFPLPLCVATFGFFFFCFLVFTVLDVVISFAVYED